MSLAGWSRGARQHPLGYVLDLKLADPAGATAFLNSPAANAFCNRCDGMVMLEPWQWIRAADYQPVAFNQGFLVVMSWLLAALAIASIAVVVGGRIIGQTRRVGLLKAVAATPRLVTVVLLAENLLLALAAAVSRSISLGPPFAGRLEASCSIVAPTPALPIGRRSPALSTPAAA